MGDTGTTGQLRILHTGRRKHAKHEDCFLTSPPDRELYKFVIRDRAAGLDLPIIEVGPSVHPYGLIIAGRLFGNHDTASDVDTLYFTSSVLQSDANGSQARSTIIDLDRIQVDDNRLSGGPGTTPMLLQKSNVYLREYDFLTAELTKKSGPLSGDPMLEFYANSTLSPPIGFITFVARATPL